MCDCEMRWYRKWYNDGWQEVDEDHIRDTDCTDPYDGMEHNIAKVSRLEITSFTSTNVKLRRLFSCEAQLNTCTCA